MNQAEKIWEARKKHKKSFVDIAAEFGLGSKQWAQQIFEQEDHRRYCDEMRPEFPEKVEFMVEPSEYLKRTDPEVAAAYVPLSVRAQKALAALGIISVYELSGVSRSQVRDMASVGRKTYKEIVNLMARYGVEFMETL